MAVIADDVDAEIEAVRAARAHGLVDPELDARDVYPLVIGLSLAWSPASPTVTADPADADAVHRRRKAALSAAARRAFRPGT